MNCTVIQRRLLSAEQPERPPADVKSHLAQCPSCRLLQRRLIQMEQRIPQLPIFPSTTKEQFLERMTAEGETRLPETLVRPSAYGFQPLKKERGLRKLSVAFALAASLLVFALAWWSWPRHPHAVPNLTRNEQVKLEQRLNISLRVDTPKERVLRLTKLAEEIHGEARALVDNSDRLDQWTQFYSRIVGQHLIEEARQLPPEDRPVVLQEVAARLTTMESDASRYAAQLKRASPRSASAFNQIALTSRKGERDLRTLMKS
ncbi:MAG: hypothetical protein ACYC3I_24930 [Gemmataceae bacterium]